MPGVAGATSFNVALAGVKKMGFVTSSDTISNSVSVPAKSVRPKV